MWRKGEREEERSHGGGKNELPGRMCVCVYVCMYVWLHSQFSSSSSLLWQRNKVGEEMFIKKRNKLKDYKSKFCVIFESEPETKAC